MCTCHTNARCPCYRNTQEYREERARQAHASRFEHAILDALRGELTGASPRARAFATLLKAQPESDNGANVADILMAVSCIYWWTRDGWQHHARLDARPAVRQVA